VFKPSYYKPEDGGFPFRVKGQTGEHFELETAKTRTGRTKLLSARIFPDEGPQVSANAETGGTLTFAS